MSCIMLIPSHAKTLADAGWTKEDIKNFISEYARRPLYQNGRGSTLGSTGLPFNPQDTVAVMPNPDAIKLIVAGGAGNMIGIIKGSSGGLTPGAGRGRLTTIKIELPADWRELVQKYKSIVPTYSLY